MKTTNDLDHWLEMRAWTEEADAADTRKRLIVEATMPEGGHIEAHDPTEPFLIPTILEIDTPDGITAGPIAYPEPEERVLEWSPTVLRVLAGTVRFEAPLSLDPRSAAGTRSITARLRYQGCIDGACLPPNTQAIETSVSDGLDPY